VRITLFLVGGGSGERGCGKKLLLTETQVSWDKPHVDWHINKGTCICKEPSSAAVLLETQTRFCCRAEWQINKGTCICQESSSAAVMLETQTHFCWPFILFPSRMFSLKANHLQTYEGSLVTYITSKNKINLTNKSTLFRVITQRVPSFRGNLSVPSSRVKNCPETSVRNYHYSLRNNPEESSSHLLRCGNLQSRKSDKEEMQYCISMYT